MTTSIANPLYDSVFKFLMEDQRVAQILISALIRKKVRSLTQTANEISEFLLDGLKLLRLDFAAEVENENGETEVITIEVQKVYLQSEIVRFRRYLAEQYANRANKEVTEKYKDRNGKEKTRTVEKAMPITSIFILGQSTIDNSHPVIYGTPQFTDADDKPILGVAENEFLVNLTHKIIVVQVPSLSQKPKTKVEKFMSIFDQSFVSPDSKHILKIDDYEDYPEGFEYVINRLVKAAATEEVRKQMTNEDHAIRELMGLVDDLDYYKCQNEIKDQMIEEKDKELESNKKELESKDQTIIASIKFLASMNIPSATIALQLNLSKDFVEKYR